jgi:2-C-methyl-D-erythritol 4-phosphate cytidylyltransferase
VLKGLNALAEDPSTDWVLVHDAARPGLSQTALNRLIAAHKNYSGAILALPVVDTMKAAQISTNKLLPRISTTIDRRHLWQAQTPQMFKAQRLVTALNTALNDARVITDEASAIEYLGDEIALVEGEASNMKITRPDDLALAEFYLQQQKITRDPLCSE